MGCGLKEIRVKKQHHL